MRRIYESDALHRDDDEPHAPRERRRSTTPQSFRSLPSSAVSGTLLPQWLCRRAVSVDVSTERTEFREGESVPFSVTMKNSLPAPVTIATASPMLWTWSVDGADEASRVPLRDPPDEPGAFAFDRGERKRFRRRWNGQFRVSETEWEPAAPGEYTIGVRVNVSGAEGKGLADETTVRVVP